VKIISRIDRFLEEVSDERRRVFSLLFSLFFHAGILILLIKVLPPTERIVYQEKITEVIIAPEEKLFAPGDPRNLPSPDEFDPFYEKRRHSRSSITWSEKGQGRGSPEESSLSWGGRRGPTFVPNLQFSLGKSSKSSQGEFSKDALIFSLMKRKQEEVPAIYRDHQMKVLDLSKYVSGGYSGGSASEAFKPSGRPSARVTRVGRAAYVEGTSFDIGPWAREVVSKIQRNWFIPASEKITDWGRVIISVTVKKDGQISETKIVSPSKLRLLDEAALKALRLSNPLPGLPDGFPEDSLSVSFEFSYHE